MRFSSAASLTISLTEGVADDLLRGIRDRADPGPVDDAAEVALEELSDSRDDAIAQVNDVTYSGGTATTTTTTTTMVPVHRRRPPFLPLLCFPTRGQARFAGQL